jgi:glucosyl-3-phosphoglycerate synthase
MLSVIIPALNEEKTIANVVGFCLQNPLVNEVIVVDDTSEDDTARLAAEAGAKVIISAQRGKGISMKEGIQAASNDVLVFLDGDIHPYPDETIALLTAPLLEDEADFVKGTFARNAGRVTELVAKPLLNIFFPGLAGFTQPLSGMIAGRKSYFKRIKFFNDYGVDIGILLDMYLMKARVTEVNIGYIENKSKPWDALGKMSKEVASAIITKAHKQHAHDDEADEQARPVVNPQRQPGDENTARQKMAIFDMDDTILKGRFLDTCAQKFGFTARLEDMRAEEKDVMHLTKQVGLLFKGKTMDELLDIVHGMEMISDIKHVVKELKQQGYIVGIISNSYTLITNYVMKNIEADFSYANQLEFFEGRATGEVNTPSYFFASGESICGHSFCKTNAVQYACAKYNVQLKHCIIAGDSKDDRCMVGHAGTGVAVRTSDDLLRAIAKLEITEEKFEPLLAYA